MDIDRTLKTPNGCSIKIKGTLGLKDGSFTGTVTVSGDKCPVQGQFVFTSATVPGKPGGNDLTMAFDTKDIAKLSKVTWSGNAKAAKMLNDQTINSELCKAIREDLKKAS
jgi:hypothetical protein